MWNLWWTKWHWDRFFPRVLRFSPVNFIPPVLHYTEKCKEKLIIVFIFITGLHNKSQGCGASIASAAGPPKNEKLIIIALKKSYRMIFSHTYNCLNRKYEKLPHKFATKRTHISSSPVTCVLFKQAKKI
jgi:hypothetical protein